MRSREIRKNFERATDVYGCSIGNVSWRQLDKAGYKDFQRAYMEEVCFMMSCRRRSVAASGVCGPDFLWVHADMIEVEHEGSGERRILSSRLQ